MVEFLYKAKYNVDSKTDRDASKTSRNKGTVARIPMKAEHPLVTHAHMYILGDKYDIPSLRDLACRNYKEFIGVQWNTKAFSESVELVYSNIIAEKDDLKNAVYETARANIQSLINEPS